MSDVDSKVAAVWAVLVGERIHDDLEWWAHLDQCRAVLAASLKRVAGERATMVTRWHVDGYSYAEIGREVGLTRERVRQLVREGHLLCPDCGAPGPPGQMQGDCTVCSVSRVTGE